MYGLEYERRMKQDSDFGLMRKLQDMHRDAEERMHLAVRQGMGVRDPNALLKSHRARPTYLETLASVLDFARQSVQAI